MRGSRSRARHDRAVINCQYSMATFSTAERKRRPHGDRKSTEMSLHLKQTFEAAVMTQLYPRSQIDIYVKVYVQHWHMDLISWMFILLGFPILKLINFHCWTFLTFLVFVFFRYFPKQILQSDGGNYSVCVNAATLAIIDAGIPMRDYVCACTVGFVDETPLADLCYAEESGGVSSLALALLPRGGQIALVQMDARLHQDHLEALIEAAMTACKGVSKVLDEVVRQHLQEVSVLSRE